MIRLLLILLFGAIFWARELGQDRALARTEIGKVILERGRGLFVLFGLAVLLGRFGGTRLNTQSRLNLPGLPRWRLTCNGKMLTFDIVTRT